MMVKTNLPRGDCNGICQQENDQTIMLNPPVEYLTKCNFPHIPVARFVPRGSEENAPTGVTKSRRTDFNEAKNAQPQNAFDPVDEERCRYSILYV